MAGNGTGPIEVKTTLPEDHYNAMLKVSEALGETQAGFVRRAILAFILESQTQIEHLAEIIESPKTGRKRA